MSSNSDPYRYDALFFDYLEEGALRSARAIVPIVCRALKVQSVLDVGCGVGAWLSAYREQGVDDVLGVDGPYVNRDRLLIPADRFHPVDVSRSFDLNRQFDLVQSLEVAEHIPPEASRTMIDNLVRHGSHVLFSAAVPGQGGENHINERTYEHWRGLFGAHGFTAYDAVRPLLDPRHHVEPWYAYNTLLYVHADVQHALPDDVRRFRVADGEAIPNVAPAWFRARAAVLSRLPVSVVTRLAILKHRIVVARRAEKR